MFQMVFAVFLLLALAVTSTLVVASAMRAGNDGDAGARARLLRSRSGELAALIAGIVLVAWFLTQGLSSRVTAVAPMIIASVMMLTSTAVDLTWPSSVATVRVARLGERGTAAPQTVGRVLIAAVALLVALLVAGGVTAAPGGASVSVSGDTFVATHGPWPGWFYAAPMLGVLVTMSVITWWSLRVIETRPAAASDGSGMDRTSRQHSTVRVLRTAALGTILTVAPVAVLMGTALLDLARALKANQVTAAQHALNWRQGLGWTLIVVGLISAASSLWVAGWRARPSIEGVATPAPAVSAR